MPNYPEMRDKIVLVTGGSKGIGLGTAKAFAEQGARVIIASRNEGRAKTGLKKLGNASDVHWYPVDLAKEKSVDTLFDQIAKTYGRLDYAFNNGGNGGVPKPVASLPTTSWRTTIEGYLTSVFLCMRSEIALMNETASVIVNNASVDGLKGSAGQAAYSAAKHGVLGLTKSAAIEHAQAGPRICAICPGWINTQSAANWMHRNPDQAETALAKIHRGRLGEPEQVASAVLWLCSAGAACAVGTILTLDGGETA